MNLILIKNNTCKLGTLRVRVRARACACACACARACAYVNVHA